MAELTGKAISELPESTTVNNSALVALSENGASKKMTLATLVGNLLKKTGDTMTGVYRFKSSNVDKDNAVSVWGNSYPVVVDKDGAYLGSVRGFTLDTGVSGVQITGQNGDYQNILRLGETANNKHDVYVTAPGTWRKALGLCYAVNDTFTNGYIIENGYVSTSTTEVWLTVSTPLSMENISTVTVTSLNGVMRGINGYLNNVASNTNFATASGYTVTATKQSNHEARVVIKKSSAYTNVDNNTPVSYAGAITLKFT